jgi:DNA-binding HxlR family transcriptional regulator
MITIELQPGDIENIRFAYSPLIELTSSFCVIQRQQKQAPYRAWMEEIRHSLAGFEFPYIEAVVPPRHYTADFVTPTPMSTQSTLEDELARVYDTPPEIIQKNILLTIKAGGENEIRRHFLVNPRDALDCLMQELRLYWQLTLAQHWGKMRAVLENDVLFHAREMALHGVDHMFENLNENLRYGESAIYLDKKHHLDQQDYSTQLDGTGIYLVPAVFARTSLSWQIVPEWKPMVIYGARGTGLWHRAETPDPDKALRLTLGTGRAKVLVALQSPAHTTELAQQLNLTSGAISQHLQRLNQAGLVESHRISHRVYYRLTQRGQQLVSLFTEI